MVVEPALDEPGLRLREQALVDVEMARAEDREILGVAVVAVDADVGRVVAEQGRERLRLRLAQERVVAVQVLPVDVPARIRVAPVRVDRRDHQDRGPRHQVEQVGIVREGQLAGEDEARFAHRRLVAVDVALDDDRR